MTRPFIGNTSFSITTLALLSITGCLATSATFEERLESDDPAARIRAVVQIARQHKMEFLPNLVDRLDDEDPAVRFYTIIALEKLAGTRLGYSYSAPAVERHKMIEAWREHISENAQQASGGDGNRSKPP